MQFYQRAMKIRWVKKIPNEEVLSLVEEKAQLTRRGSFDDRMLRHPRLLNLIMEGSAEGKNYNYVEWKYKY